MKARMVRHDGDTVRTRLPRPALDETRVIERVQRDAIREAEAIMARAEAEAQALLARARQQADADRRAAEQRAERNATEALLKQQQQLRAAAETLLAQVRGDVTDLAVAIAEHLLGEQLRLEPALVGALVTRVVRQAAGHGPIRVQLHPDDLAQLQPQLAALRAAAGQRIELVEDAAIGRAGCVVATAIGEVDGRLQTQLDCLRAVFAEDGDDRP